MENYFFPPFLRSKRFPQLCGGVSIEYEPRRGMYVCATRDIPCGEVVCLDVGKVINLDPSLCCYCLNELPVDCSRRYCEECIDQDEIYGPFEQPFMEKLQDLGMFRLAIHLVLSYSSEEIMTFLENGEFKRADIFNINSMRSDSLAAALSLQVDTYPVDLSSTNTLVNEIIGTLDKHPHWRMVPRDRRRKAFKTLLNLISCRLMSNAHSIYPVNRLESRSKDTQLGSATPSGVGLFPVASWFNHSCRANVNSFFHGNKLIFISMGIRKGEEVCDSYGVSFFKHTKEERKEFLAGRGFTCDCSVCASTDSIDDLLEPIIEHPDLILKSLPNVEDYRQYRNTLPDGHKNIETIAEMYLGSIGRNDPKQRLFLYGEILECQRRRGLHFSPDQIKPLLNSVLASYDAMMRYTEKRQSYMDNMQLQLFAALVRMRAFYGELYPAFHAAKSLGDRLIEIEENGSQKDLSDAIENLRSIVEDLKPALPTLE